MARESNSSIMSVAELIDCAFGEPNGNVVHHKLIQTILFILANQLRVLQRRVEVVVGHDVPSSASSLSITEVKVHAMQKKKKKSNKYASDVGANLSGKKKSGLSASSGKKLISSVASTGTRGSTAAGGTKIRTSVVAGAGPRVKLGGTMETKEPASEKTTSSDKTSTITTSERTSSAMTSSAKTSSSIKTSSDKTSSFLTSTDKTTTDKTSSEKPSSDEIAADKSSSDKPSSDKTGTGKLSSDQTSTDKITTVKTFSDKTSTDETAPGKSSSDKTSSDKASTEKTTSEKTSGDRKSYSKSTADATLTDKSITSKTPSDKIDIVSSLSSSSDKASMKSTSGKTTTAEASSAIGGSKRAPKLSSQDYLKVLEDIEEARERELRIIHQRPDSRDDRYKTPSPMASLDSVEASYEKLLIVERIPADEARARLGKRYSQDRTPRISVVTQKQFENLETLVEQLQQKFSQVSLPGFPENAKLMEDLRKGASLTDAMAALQLSARLEATEKTLEQMMGLVTELASKTPGIDLLEPSSATDDMQVIFGGAGPIQSKKSKVSKKGGEPMTSPSATSYAISLPQYGEEKRVEEKDQPELNTTEESAKVNFDRVTYDELDAAMQELYNEITKTVNSAVARSAINAENAFKIASKLESKLEASLNLGNRMDDIETLVSNYADQINILDTGLSSQLTNYQEELTQMQHDLESGLENMAEVLANTGCDTTAVAELNSHFSNLQNDIDNTAVRQKELRDIQNELAVDLQALRQQIELLNETKSDREEVADALRDKAGLGALNGLVSLEQFDAVRGDFEARIRAAYDKFNNQEVYWQKAIDDLLRELSEKAEYIQLVGLRDDITKHLEILRSRLNAMMEIVGEPKAAALSKRIHRDAMCLSCAMPAQMDLEVPTTIPALPALRPAAIGAEAATPKEDGDHKRCYPGFPIPHPRDPRSHVCNRWCGGSHTLLPNTLSRAPPGMIITSGTRDFVTEIGTDGKTYLVDAPQEAPIPCSPCNILAHKETPEPLESFPDNKANKCIHDGHSDMTPSDFLPTYGSVMTNERISMTPPAIIEDD